VIKQTGAKIMKTITANIPSRKVTWAGKSQVYPSRVDTFTQDSDGRWSNPEMGTLTEADVIDICRKASNWAAIKSAHFPMFGFHN